MSPGVGADWRPWQFKCDRELSKTRDILPQNYDHDIKTVDVVVELFKHCLMFVFQPSAEMTSDIVLSQKNLMFWFSLRAIVFLFMVFSFSFFFSFHWFLNLQLLSHQVHLFFLWGKWVWPNLMFFNSCKTQQAKLATLLNFNIILTFLFPVTYFLSEEILRLMLKLKSTLKPNVFFSVWTWCKINMSCMSTPTFPAFYFAVSMNCSTFLLKTWCPTPFVKYPQNHSTAHVQTISLSLLIFQLFSC